MQMFCSALPEEMMYGFGKLYKARPVNIKTWAELLVSIKPTYWKYLRDDTGDVPRTEAPPTSPSPEERQLATTKRDLPACTSLSVAPLRRRSHGIVRRLLALVNVGSATAALGQDRDPARAHT